MNTSRIPEDASERIALERLEPGSTATSQFRPPDLAGIPVELRKRRQWVCWRAEPRNEGMAKVPFSPETHNRAKIDQPESFASFEVAWSSYREGDYDGIGFVLTADDPFVAIDIDEMNEVAVDIITDLSSYTEISPSGRGTHTFIRAHKSAPGCKAGKLEIYDHHRFIAVTGHLFGSAPPSVEDRQDALDRLCGRLFPRVTPPSMPRGAPTEDDEHLIRRAHCAMNGAAFARLWAGDRTGFPSASEADWRLCQYLGYWTGGDELRIDRLFRLSGLFRRNKWDRPCGKHGTYGWLTIRRAIRK